MFLNVEAITMHLSGVTDAATQKAAAHTLRQVEGVRSVSVSCQTAEAHITYRPEKTSVAALTAALAEAGFRVT